MGLGKFKSRAAQLRNVQKSAEARLWQALRNRRLAHTHVSAAAAVRDTERTRILESLGFLIVRVTNVDIFENLDGVLEMISDTLNP